MELAKLNAVIEKTKEDLGNGFISGGIWGKDGQLISAHNALPKAAAMLEQVTEGIISSLKTSKFPKLNKYYLIDLADNKSIMVMHSAEFQYGLALDMEKVQMGMLMSVVGPEVYALFVDAVK